MKNVESHEQSCLAAWTMLLGSVYVIHVTTHGAMILFCDIFGQATHPALTTALFAVRNWVLILPCLAGALVAWLWRTNRLQRHERHITGGMHLASVVLHMWNVFGILLPLSIATLSIGQ